VTSLLTPNQAYLTGYKTNAPGISLPAFPLPGSIVGLTWGKSQMPVPLPEDFSESASIFPTPAWRAALTPASDVPGARHQVVPLNEINAPFPYLHDLVDESFIALRDALAIKIGWDFLSTLENAFVPLTTPLFPGMMDDWLYTGRAFSLNPGPINAGWMLIVREDFGASPYWRVYLRTRFQDGSQGLPLHDLPWNFNARYSGDPRYYEQGGTLAQNIPTGYWLDFTSLASDYGWERLPALITWHSAMPASRYNEFVYSDDLTWDAAMAELYPPSALYTPTHMAPPTLTPTRTPWPSRTPTPTRTPRTTILPTRTVTSTP
jgi:TolB protein